MCIKPFLVKLLCLYKRVKIRLFFLRFASLFVLDKVTFNAKLIAIKHLYKRLCITRIFKPQLLFVENMRVFTWVDKVLAVR